jgi:hypothetical protein
LITCSSSVMMISIYASRQGAPSQNGSATTGTAQAR